MFKIGYFLVNHVAHCDQIMHKESGIFFRIETNYFFMSNFTIVHSYNILKFIPSTLYCKRSTFFYDYCSSNRSCFLSKFICMSAWKFCQRGKSWGSVSPFKVFYPIHNGVVELKWNKWRIIQPFLSTHPLLKSGIRVIFCLQLKCMHLCRYLLY